MLRNIGRLRAGPVNQSPIVLFASGAQGVWYDPSDFSTMYQDSAGTTPVTAVGQPVGFLVDKSQGGSLGSELLQNGDFSSATGWSAPVAGAAITGGALVFDGATSIASSATVTTGTVSASAVVGTWYRITYTIVGGTTNAVSVNFGGALGTARTAAGTYSEMLQATSTASLSVQARLTTGSRTGSIDNISVKALPGNHATQATATARPSDQSPGVLTADGVDDAIAGLTGGAGSTGFFFCAAVKVVGGDGTARTIFSDVGTNTGYRVRIASTNNLALGAGNGTAFTSVTTADSVSAGNTYVLTCWDDGVNLNAQVNLGTVAQAARPAVSAGPGTFSFFKDNNASTAFANVGFYEAVYVKNGGVTDSQRFLVQQHCARLAGISL